MIGIFDNTNEWKKFEYTRRNNNDNSNNNNNNDNNK